MEEDKGQKRTFSTRTKSLLQGSFKGSLLGAGGVNKLTQHLYLPQIRFKDKQNLKSESQCQICYCSYKLNKLEHFCKVCGLSVCSSCSSSTINKQRACDLCSFVYSNPERQIIKNKAISDLKKIAKQMIDQKDQAQVKLKSLEMQIPSEEMIKNQQDAHYHKISQLNKRLQQMKDQRILAEERLNQMKQN